MTKETSKVSEKEPVVEAKVEPKAAVVETKKKLTKEEWKEKFRRTPLEYTGRLYIDDKYKRPDKVLRIDNDDPATRNYLQQLGYTIVQRDIEVGSGSLSEAKQSGSAVHIEQGIMGSQPGILYEIDKDMYDARKELEVEDNNKAFEQKVKENQREDQHKK